MPLAKRLYFVYPDIIKIGVSRSTLILFLFLEYKIFIWNYKTFLYDK